jgi:hypothetical protein
LQVRLLPGLPHSFCLGRLLKTPSQKTTPGKPGDFSQVPALISAGDSFLLNAVSAIMNSKAWTGNSVIFITWDESDFTGGGFNGFGDDTGCCDSVPGQGGGHVVTIAISHSDHSPRTSNVAYNHQSMLATIQDGWQLGCLAFTCDTVNVPPRSRNGRGLQPLRVNFEPSYLFLIRVQVSDPFSSSASSSPIPYWSTDARTR